VTIRVLEDGSGPGLRAASGRDWQCISDRVMGGVSQGNLRRAVVYGESALHLTGAVSLDNNGGFLQMALDTDPFPELHAVRLRVCGTGRYNVHLRTDQTTRVWQSWRATFHAGPDWADIVLPLASFAAHRIDEPINPARLRRIGIVAIGQAMPVDLALARLELR
jgi:adhesin HecA-like repeat protein